MFRIRTQKKRAVFLISVLFLTTILAMFIGAALESGIWGLKRGQNLSDVAAARRAASGGVEYALARLKQDPQWKANTASTVTVNEPDFFVVEEYGNVIGVIHNGAQISQFRIRFNYNDGAAGADGMPDTSPSMNMPTSLVCLNNMVPNSSADVPRADGAGNSVPGAPTVYTTTPGHSIFLVVEGRCGDWLGGATVANPNPAPPALGAVSAAQVESVFKVTNALAAGTPAVAASAGNFKATLATLDKKDNLTLDSASGTVTGRLRSRGNLDIAGGKAGEYNLVAGKGGGEFRALGSATQLASPSVIQKPEGATDTLYPIPWSDVHQALATNSLPAGTYVFWDDGSLHYFDMNVTDYYNFMSNPLNHSNAGLPLLLPASVVPSFTGSGSTLKAKLTITADTLVQAATNTTDIAILPQKGVAGGAGTGGAAPSASTMYSQIDSGNSAFNQGGWSMPSMSSFTLPSPAAYGLMNRVATWSAGMGQGTYAAGNWNLPGGNGALNNLATAAANGNINGAGLTLVTQQISAYIAANPSDPDWATFAGAMSMPAGSAQDEIPGVGSQANSQNLELKFDPAASTSATLTGPGNVTIGAKLSGNGASITAEGNLSLLGLGVNMSALMNPNQGVSLYSKKDITISTFDKAANLYHDVALKGVVYSWGNFKAILGATGIPQADWGKLKLTGAMIAYGKDPSDLVNPPTSGNVEVLAGDATLKYDASYMLDFSNTLPANITLARVRWLEK